MLLNLLLSYHGRFLDTHSEVEVEMVHKVRIRQVELGTGSIAYEI